VNSPARPSWFSRHSRKVELTLFVVTLLLVCNNAAAVLGYDAFFDPWRPLSSLMISSAIFINAAMAVWRPRSLTVVIVLGLVSIGLLVSSSITIR
jgi:hypothetical protein